MTEDDELRLLKTKLWLLGLKVYRMRTVPDDCWVGPINVLTPGIYDLARRDPREDYPSELDAARGWFEASRKHEERKREEELTITTASGVGE